MKLKQALQGRILVSLLLLAFIVVAGVGIVTWVFIVKAPPGNAVLIESSEESPTRVVAGSGPGGVPTAGTSVSPSAIRSAAPGEQLIGATAVIQETPISLGDLGPEPTPASPTIVLITVYVSGAVNKPGVYSLPADVRVADAIELAGGASADADLELINLAAHLEDEEHISVPIKGAPTAAVLSTSAPKTAASPTQVRRNTPEAVIVKVNVNTATSVELESLPGIGPVLAQRIVAYREENGPFKTIEDLTRVPGIKSAM